jgi:hypothetical protein
VNELDVSHIHGAQLNQILLANQDNLIIGVVKSNVNSSSSSGNSSSNNSPLAFPNRSQPHQTTSVATTSVSQNVEIPMEVDEQPTTPLIVSVISSPLRTQ